MMAIKRATKLLRNLVKTSPKEIMAIPFAAIQCPRISRTISFFINIWGFAILAERQVAGGGEAVACRPVFAAFLGLFDLIQNPVNLATQKLRLEVITV